MGEMRVDLHHLLEDLRDAYPGGVEETILTEVVANSLDSGARRIVFGAEPADAALSITDDGSGMKRRDLARYHDLAASTKTRGQGIGFAGVGIKLASGKVIKRGWDWLGVSSAHPDRVSGLVEAPALSECLTLNKGDFTRTGARGSLYLS